MTLPVLPILRTPPGERALKISLSAWLMSATVIYRQPGKSTPDPLTAVIRLTAHSLVITLQEHLALSFHSLRASMKRKHAATLFFAVLVSVAFAQESSSGHKPPPSQKPDLERQAVVNLEKFVAGESRYAMSHPNEGFACDLHVLTLVEWPNSNAKLLEPALLSGMGNYKFSASCPHDSKPGTKLNVFAVPLDPHENLRAFCKTETFGPYETPPYVATGGSPIRSISPANAGSCLVSGEPLK
jgi:hypothetical protein